MTEWYTVAGSEHYYCIICQEREEQKVKMEILTKELEFLKCKVKEDDVLIKELQSSAACSQEMVAELTNTLHIFSPMAGELAPCIGLFH